MRFMIIAKASADSEAGVLPPAERLANMAGFHEELARAGVLLDAGGLQPSRHGWRIRHVGGRQQVVDGPFADTTALVAGYTLIQVRSRDEAMAWARRCPAPHGDMTDGEIEVRQLFEVADLAPASNTTHHPE